ncbi:MAG TPA: hypothetical protein VG938_20180 [Verrucomicrobiae bacterium]|jgi:hypothetical protein|nr:hypothetical protein [Verrucomicrobiae bacterium]
MTNVTGRTPTAGGDPRPTRAVRHSPFVILLALLFLFLPAKSFSQSSNRWLLIFNTSSAMRDRLDGVKNLTQDLMTTAMHGNLRRGDTIGIWTYDHQLRADEAPLLTWDSDAAQPFAEHAVEFLSHHHYEKNAVFGDVLTNMLRVIKSSDVITVILVSDGSDPVQGTPFDSELDAFYKKNYRDQKKAHMPVVTVFRGQHGNLTAHTEGLAPWPVEIPAVPPPEVAKAAPPPPPAPPEPQPVVHYGKPLIVIGKKPELVPAPPPADNAAATNPATAEQRPAAPEPKVTPQEKSEPAMGAPTTNTSENETWAKTTAPTISPEVETATTVTPQSPLSARNLAIVSVAFAAIVCSFLILAARRARRQSQSSLITRSLDREDR